MPNIPKQWLDAIVYLYPTEDDARQGARAGATGFIVSVPAEHDRFVKGMAHQYAVTNAHAVEGRSSLAVRINKLTGGFDVLTLQTADWVTQPDGDDIAVATLNLNLFMHKLASVDRSMLLTQELLDHWDFGPGDEVFFIGRYVDHEGKAHNVPTVRSGIVSAFPAEPISQRPGRDHDQESILVEARSLSGYSGSPVFITHSPFIDRSPEPGGPPVVVGVTGGPCFLLGIDWGHHSWSEPVRSAATGQPVGDDTYTKGNSGMMMVVPATKLLSLLDAESMVTKRREAERQLLDSVGYKG